MARVYVDTDDLSKEQLVEMILDKERLLLKLQKGEETLLNIYEKFKVSDTFMINRNNHAIFIKNIEKALHLIKYGKIDDFCVLNESEEKP